VVGAALVWPARLPCQTAGSCFVPDVDGQPALALCLRGVDAVAAWSKEAASVSALLAGCAVAACERGRVLVRATGSLIAGLSRHPWPPVLHHGCLGAAAVLPRRQMGEGGGGVDADSGKGLLMTAAAILLL
jgi:hypothetical protein